MPSKRRAYEDDSPRSEPRPKKQDARDVESGDSIDDQYLFTKYERKNFVAKVYGMLTGYLIFSFVVIFSVNSSESIREWMMDYYWVGFIFMGGQMITSIILVCFTSVQRSFPWNLIILTLCVIFFTGFISFVAAKYDVRIVWLAFLATGAITVLISLVAKFSPWDVTGCGMLLFVGFLALTVFSLIAFIISFFIVAPILYLIIFAIATVLTSLYLMFVTQLILGGRRGEFSTSDVILAVVVLYTTIMDLFFYMMYLINACCSGDG